jgi:amino acid adenylation domain-containing protein
MKSKEEVLQKRRANLSEAQKALLRKRLRGEQSDSPSQAPISPRPQNEPAPLSFSQERLWFIYELDPDSPNYNEAGATVISGDFDLTSYQKAMFVVMQRHEILRTMFRTVEGQLVQIVAPLESLDIPLIDLSTMPAEVREDEAKRIVKAEAKRPFNLSEAFPWHLAVLRLASDQHIILFTLHHIACDGWSMVILNREIASLYTAFSEGKSIDLPEPALQYADFAYWQRQYFQHKSLLTKHLTYWQKKLDGLQSLKLPIDKPYASLPTSRGALEQVQLPSGIDKAIHDLGQQENVTDFMISLAVLKTLLHRYSHQTKIAVGAPVANRDRPELEHVVGFLINTLVLCSDLSGDPTFRELLQRVRQTALEAYAHQDLPIDYLISEVSYERVQNRNPLIQVLFIWQNWQNISINQEEHSILEALDIVGGQTHTDTAKFEITLSMERTADSSIVCNCEYNTDLFYRETIIRMLAHFQNIFTHVLANPDTKLSEIPLLTPSEQQQMLHEWNNTQVNYESVCIHTRFEEQAARTPDALALIASEQQFSYRELNERANQLAHYLHQYDIGPETLIGLAMTRSPEMVISLLAVLKAGCAYVPLDPAYPQEQLTYILADAQVNIVLTTTAIVEQLPINQITAICLDVVWSTVSQQATTNPKTTITPQNLVYVIYTSGSTGNPKGVAITHHSLNNYTKTFQTEYNITLDDRVLQFASINFDTAAEEIYPTLTAGASLHLRSETMLDSVETFLAQCKQWGITILDLPTAYWHELVLALHDEALALPDTIRLVIIGGEQALLDRLVVWHQLVKPSVHLVNTYGPTETTIVATQCTLLPGEKNVPIGQPIHNAQAYVLNQNLQPVPINVIGDLYIGGDGLARGYLHQAQKTAERFIPNPFKEQVGSRLYKTGDRVYYRANGNLEFVGRADNQVKVRGFRVELGEIETVLRQHTTVEDTVVRAWSQEHNNQLVAYIVTRKPDIFDQEELRRYLHSKLPFFMIPAAFVILETLPRTPNKKIDVQALPRPEAIQAEIQTAYIPPRNELEQKIAAIWEDVLDVRPVSIEANFYALGGHSLLAIRILARVRQQLEIDIPLRTLLEFPTIVSFAHEIHQRQEPLAKSTIPRIARDKPIPLSFAQHRLWFLDQFEPDLALYNLFGGMHLKGDLNILALEQAINTLIERHETLRTTFDIVGDDVVQIIHNAAALDIPAVDLQELSPIEQEDQLRNLINEEAQTPFNLTQGPLIRFKLVYLGKDNHILLYTIHHIIFDEWSMGIFKKEIARLYDAYNAGLAITLPDLPIQYADFAVWQRQQLEGNHLQTHLVYWKQQLAHAPGILELPIDYPRPPLQTFNGAIHSFFLPQALRHSLQALAQEESATLFMTLLAVFKLLLFRYSGQSQIVVGTPIANRNHVETEGLIGFFLNTLVLHTEMGDNPAFRTLLARVREVALGAYTHQELPFEQLIEVLQPERNLSIHPLFQVMFVLQNLSGTPSETNLLEELQVEFVGADQIMARFDLTLDMQITSSGIQGEIIYNTDLFERATIIRMADHYQVLLEAVVATPDKYLLDFPLLAPEEQKQLLFTWNDTHSAYPHAECIHTLIGRQAQKTPQDVAVIMDKASLTYGQLNEQANQVANYLRQMGVGPETLVGLCLDRSLDMVVGLLGILNAGGAYVPLDPAYPQERLHFMLEDSQASVLLTQHHLVNKFPDTQVQVICLDQDWPIIAQEKTISPLPLVCSDNLAYLIYTSGSTGKPKGVAISHKSAVAFLSWAADIFTDEDLSGVLAGTSICFDLSIFELFLPLSRGGCIILVEDVLQLSTLPYANQVTLINTVPSAMQTLLNSKSIPATVHTVNLAGESLKRALANQLYEETTVQSLYNLYGPSEDTTYSTYTKVPRLEEREPTIGRPIANTQTYILDTNYQPVPVGVIGELYLGGAGLSRGYFNRANLTAVKYIPNPFSQMPGDRLYQTGDLARYLPNGQIAFLGRRDHQIKIRGFRIELGEIEAVLMQHPTVQTAVAILREDHPNDKRIVAYFTTHNDLAPTIQALRQYLGDRLPAHMIPSAFVNLESFPLTPNGKLNRSALPAPLSNRPVIGDTFVPPSTPDEEKMALIWSKILHIEQVGITDNFFELGGHSLIGMQLMLRIRNAFQIELPLRLLFEEPTISGLIKNIEIIQWATTNPDEDDSDDHEEFVL